MKAKTINSIEIVVDIENPENICEINPNNKINW